MMVVGRQRHKRQSHAAFQRAFALPTVLISSIVLIIVLTVAVSATSAVRENLLTQYYDQLAQVAGEAGVAYAKSCLAANGNVPLWSNAKPLTPQTDCTGTVVGGYPQYVTSNGDVRSSFSVGLPTLDANGFAVSIPNSGYVQLLRTSTGAVWKTYTQPTAQAAVVPDLCSGVATSDLGWNNAAITTSTATNLIANAQTISLSPGVTLYNPGPAYFRKDFSVTQSGSYTIQVRADDSAIVYLDGQQVTTTAGYNTITSTSVPLNAGCHTMSVSVINASIAQSNMNLSFSLSAAGSSHPVMVSDTSWRVSTGNSVPFSNYRYYQSSTWAPATQIYTTSGNATWAAQGGWPDVTAGWVGSANGTPGSYPFTKYTYLIDNHKDVWNFAGSTQVKIYVQCDDSCSVYLDGNQIIASTSWTTVTSTTLTLDAGQHQIGVELYNGGVSNNSSGLMFTAIDTSTGRVIDNTSSGQWVSSNSWLSSSSIPYSYPTDFLPTPDVMSGRHTFNVLVIGGGGGGGANGGGGGGAGGVVINNSFQAAVGSYPVTIGTGGTAAPSGVGGSGGNTIFGSAALGLITAYGGGGGASRDGGAQGQSGGSSGGGGGATASPRHLSSAALQGNIGGNGTTPDPGCPAGGGGGGGAGGVGGIAVSGAAGNGGYGLTTTIGGTSLKYAGGGAGGIVCVANGSNGTPAAGYGGGVAGTSPTANSGGGGGGGSGSVSPTNGATGKVVIWYLVGTLTATGGTTTTSSDGLYTIQTFTSSGTFAISALN